LAANNAKVIGSENPAFIKAGLICRVQALNQKYFQEGHNEQ